MRQEWEPEDLIEVWTLLEEDQERLRNKSGANRLGFALLLKFSEVEARFPEDAGEIPVPAVSYVAQQVKVPAEEWAAYDWSGRAIKQHLMEIRGAFGFRECTEEDQAQLAEWLAVELCGVELNRDRLAEAVVARCRNDRLEPPTPGRIARLVGSAVSTFEERFCAATVGRLSAATRSRLDDLIAEDAGTDAESAGGGGTFFTELKADPGALGLDSLLAEVNKLQRVRALELPPALFGDVSEKLVAAWRARAAKEYPSDLRAAAGPVRYTLLATLCHVRETEITDSLVELFIQLVQKINTRAEKKVEGEFNKELKRVRGKEGILLRLAEAAVAEPGGTVRKVIYPVAGESTLKALAAEAAANEARYRARVRMVLRSSYSNHWRRMLSPLLNALEPKCNNTAYRPVMDAIDLLKRYLDQPIAKEGAFFDEAEKIPLAGVVREEWRKAVVDERGRVERIPYELCVLVALRDALRRREIWVPVADRWRNPEDDLPPDFEDNRDVHYDAIRQPQDPEKFIGALRKRLREALTRFDTALGLGTTGGVDIVRRAGPAALHPRRPEASDVPGDRGAGTRGAYGVHLRLPRRRGAPARDQRRAPGRGELELRQPRPVLRQGRRPDRFRQGVPGSLDARPAPAPVRAGARQHPAPPGHPERGEVAEEAHRRRPAGPVPAVLDPREPLRPVRARHAQLPRPGPQDCSVRPA